MRIAPLVAAFFLVFGCIAGMTGNGALDEPGHAASKSGFRVEVPYKTVKVTDNATGRGFTERQWVDVDGLHIEFEPAIPVCNSGTCPDEDRTDSHHVTDIDIGGTGFILVSLEEPNGTVHGTVVLGQESGYGRIYPFGCDNNESISQSLEINGTTYFLTDLNSGLKAGAIMCKGPECGKPYVLYEAYRLHDIGGGYFKIWDYQPCAYGGVCQRWIAASEFSNILELSDSGDVTLGWRNRASANPALKSVFIPWANPIFEKLTGRTNN